MNSTMNKAFFFRVLGILMVLCCCQKPGCCVPDQTYETRYCDILKPTFEPWDTKGYIITATARNYSISAICRCFTGSPKWRYNQHNEDGKYTYLDLPLLCLNNNQVCDASPHEVLETYNSSYYFYRNLTDYVVNKTTVLICGNDYNHARALLSIVIDQPQKNCSTDDKVLSSSNSLMPTIQPTPSVSVSSSQSTTQLTSASDDVTISSSFFNNMWSEMSSFACTTDTTTVTTTVTVTQQPMHTLSSSTSTMSFTSPPPTSIVQGQIEDCKSFNYINIYLGAASGVMLLVIVALTITLVLTCIKANRQLNINKEEPDVRGSTYYENKMDEAQNPIN